MTEQTTTTSQDQFAKNVIRCLDQTIQATPVEVAERLRFARERALGAQKVASNRPAWLFTKQSNGSLALGGGNYNFFNKLGMIAPLLVLVIGLVVIHQLQNDYRAKEIAAVDSALLTDDLPPAAYVDQGFGQFLKLQQER